MPRVRQQEMGYEADAVIWGHDLNLIKEDFAEKNPEADIKGANSLDMEDKYWNYQISFNRHNHSTASVTLMHNHDKDEFTVMAPGHAIITRDFQGAKKWVSEYLKEELEKEFNKPKQ